MPDGSDGRQPTITVTGTGSADADPDRVEVHLLLSSEDPDRQKAFRQVASRSQRLTKLLDSLEIPGHRRHTTGIDLHEVSSPERKTVGYRAQTGMSVRLESEGPLEVLLSRAVKEVGASVGGLNWYLSSGHPARLEAVRRASLDARSRAQAAAEALRLSVADVTEIRLLGSPTFRPRHFAMASVALEPARMRKAAVPEVEPGQLSASADVEVTFRLQPDPGTEGNS
ncbi:MAG: SIMPL domain-containing protein [Candidatus Dormiibacterota bacterium]